MTAVDQPARLDVGTLLEGPARIITHERALWYGDGLMTSAAGERRLAMPNIHTDEAYARSQGLPGAIADGMHSTNWLSSLLTRTFGRDYLENGRLRTKYIKPTYVGSRIRVLAKVTSAAELAGGIRYELDVWTEDPEGAKLTVGDASVEVRAV
jgi:3-hydroxybutyryl-CoA dehydratase